MDPKDILKEGRKILDPIMSKNGFSFKITNSGSSSGGNFVACEYRKGDKRLEFHVRYNLGLVTYNMGGVELTHSDYMRLKNAHNKYPGFSNNPVDGFRDLGFDLENFCLDFIVGKGDELLRLSKTFQENPDQFKGLP
jgi:hypothetical protein